jgi:hypothetical protein
MRRSRRVGTVAEVEAVWAFQDALSTRIGRGSCFEAAHVVVGSLPMSIR